MKALLIALMVLAGFSRSESLAAQNAFARMFSFSVKFSKGTGAYGLYSLDLTTIDASVNGELAPASSGSYDSSAALILYDETFAEEPITGALYLNLPPYVDANNDGFDDFYDATKPCSGTSQGMYSFPGWGSGSLTASWSRAAGSKSGTCVLNLQFFGQFTHSFEVLDYRGTLSYVPGDPLVSGALSLVKSGQPGNLIGGNISFEKDPADPINWFTVPAGSFTNANAQTLPFYEGTFDRDPVWPTNYYGVVEFMDGNPDTEEADYIYWMLSIDDLNDADHDGIPDFSDTPVVGRRAVLSLSKTSHGWAMTISADPGTTWTIEKASSLTGTWSSETSVAITVDPQTLDLPNPSGNTFWRAVKQ